MDVIFVGLSILLCLLTFGFIELCVRLMAGVEEKR
jgi:hypothetical protein